MTTYQGDDIRVVIKDAVYIWTTWRFPMNSKLGFSGVLGDAKGHILSLNRVREFTRVTC